MSRQEIVYYVIAAAVLGVVLAVLIVLDIENARGRM